MQNTAKQNYPCLVTFMTLGQKTRWAFWTRSWAYTGQWSLPLPTDVSVWVRINTPLVASFGRCDRLSPAKHHKRRWTSDDEHCKDGGTTPSTAPATSGTRSARGHQLWWYEVAVETQLQHTWRTRLWRLSKTHNLFTAVNSTTEFTQLHWSINVQTARWRVKYRLNQPLTQCMLSKWLEFWSKSG